MLISIIVTTCFSTAAEALQYTMCRMLFCYSISHPRNSQPKRGEEEETKCHSQDAHTIIYI